MSTYWVPLGYPRRNRTFLGKLCWSTGRGEGTDLRTLGLRECKAEGSRAALGYRAAPLPPSLEAPGPRLSCGDLAEHAEGGEQSNKPRKSLKKYICGLCQEVPV